MAHHPGKFVWFELNAKDLEGAKRFYGELLGWRVQAVPMGGSDYPLIFNGETMIGGIVPLQGAPRAHWLSYLSVADVDATIEKAKKNGGKVVRPAIDFPTVGRFALLSDPEGGLLFAFRAEKDDPDDRAQRHGDWHWNELWSSDGEKSAEFYRKTFSLEVESMPMPGMKYHVLKAGNVPRAGIMTSPVPGIHWLPYVCVDQVDECTKRAKRLGGEVMAEPQDIPSVGRFAVLKDSEGAAFGIITPSA